MGECAEPIGAEFNYYNIDGNFDRVLSIVDYLKRTVFDCGRVNTTLGTHHEKGDWFSVYLHLDQDIIVKLQGPAENYEKILTQADWYVSMGKIDPKKIDSSKLPETNSNGKELFHWLGSHRGHEQYVSVYLGWDADFFVKVAGQTESYDKIMAYANWYQNLGKMDIDNFGIE
jgi:hypothetical protein